MNECFEIVIINKQATALAVALQTLVMDFSDRQRRNLR